MERAVLRNGDEQRYEGMVRFVCISDTHNATYTMRLPQGDVLLHSGDFTKRGSAGEVLRFNSFLGSLSFSHKLVIAGNHDLPFDTVHFPQLKESFSLDNDMDSLSVKALLTNCTYLEDSGTTVFGYRVWGSPWQPKFCEWAFNLDIGPELESKWALIPTDTDILLTHAPPRSILDSDGRGNYLGCPLLYSRVREVRPKVHVFGHIHEGYGTKETEETLFVNASSVTKWYKQENEPVVFDLPVRD